VPTFTEAGLPQFDATGNWGLLTPAGTPDRVVAVLGDALARLRSTTPSSAKTLLSQGITPESGTAQQFAAVLQSESDQPVEADRRSEHQTLGIPPCRATNRRTTLRRCRRSSST
jgi:tripartite-type tricarboxylate transporter receptor subunit TctC